MASPELDPERALAAMRGTEDERREFFASAYSSWTSDQLIDKLSQWGRQRWASAQLSADEVEQNTIEFLENVGRYAGPDYAIQVANGLMLRMGYVATKFRGQIDALEAQWRAEQAVHKAHHDYSKLPHTHSSIEVPHPEPSKFQKAKESSIEVPTETAESEQGPHPEKPKKKNYALGGSIAMDSVPGDDTWRRH